MTNSCVWSSMKLNPPRLEFSNMLVTYIHKKYKSCSVTFCILTLLSFSIVVENTRVAGLLAWGCTSSQLLVSFLELHRPSALRCHHIHISLYSHCSEHFFMDELWWLQPCCVVSVFLFLASWVFTKRSTVFLTISATFADIWHIWDIWDDFIPKEISCVLSKRHGYIKKIKSPTVCH